jgi:hypothetical protein
MIHIQHGLGNRFFTLSKRNVFQKVNLYLEDHLENNLKYKPHEIRTTELNNVVIPSMKGLNPILTISQQIKILKAEEVKRY